MRDQPGVAHILQRITQHARWVINYAQCSIAWYDAGTYTLQQLDEANLHPPTQPYRLDQGAVGRALQRRHPVRVQHAGPDDDLPAGTRAALIVPLLAGGELIGTLNFFAAQPAHYTLDDLRVATALATQLASVLHNLRLFDEIVRARDELRTVLESISDAVLVLQEDHTIRLCNSAVTPVLRVDRNTLQGQPLWSLTQPSHAHQTPVLNEKCLESLCAALRNGGATRSGMVHPERSRTLEWVLAPLVVKGERHGHVLTFRDVSDRQALGQLRDDMIHMLVHDLRTPLNGLLLGLEMVAIAIQRGDEQARDELLQAAQLAANKLLSKSNLILEVGKLEAGKLELERKWANLAAILCDVFEECRVLAEHKAIVYSIETENALAYAEVDVGLIQRVAENLLGNAIKFTPPGGCITLGSRTNQHVGMIEVWIEDTGPGIPAADRDLIFEKYVQTNHNSGQNGSGLGLAFCKLAVQAHGGTIGVEPRAGSGSRFWFKLPIGGPAAL